MGEREKQFRDSLRVDNSKVIEDFIRTERMKVTKDRRLSNEQKRERIELLDEAMEEIEFKKREQKARETIQKMNESQWFK